MATTQPSKELLQQQIETIQDDIKELKQSVVQLTEVITKLAVYDEKNTTLTRALEKALERQDEFEQRLTNLETNQTKILATAQGVSLSFKTMWAVVGASITAFISSFFTR